MSTTQPLVPTGFALLLLFTGFSAESFVRSRESTGGGAFLMFQTTPVVETKRELAGQGPSRNFGTDIVPFFCSALQL